LHISAFGYEGSESTGGGGGDCKEDFIQSFSEAYSLLLKTSDRIADKNYTDPRLQDIIDLASYSNQAYELKPRLNISPLNNLFSTGNIEIKTVAEIKNCRYSEIASACAYPEANTLELDCEGENSWLSIKNLKRKYSIALHEAFWWHETVSDKNSDLSTFLINEAIEIAKNHRASVKNKKYKTIGHDVYAYNTSCSSNKTANMIAAVSEVEVLSTPQIVNGVNVVKVEIINNAFANFMDWKKYVSNGCTAYIRESAIDTNKSSRSPNKNIQFQIRSF
jgi:hypothetical protein